MLPLAPIELCGSILKQLLNFEAVFREFHEAGTWVTCSDLYGVAATYEPSSL
jgi:hypothetical protein